MEQLCSPNVRKAPDTHPTAAKDHGGTAGRERAQGTALLNLRKQGEQERGQDGEEAAQMCMQSQEGLGRP